MNQPNTLHKDILVELECPICTNYMTPPIKQCSSGHCICRFCMNKLPKCPLCQASFTSVRNTFLESMARKIRYPCSNKAQGCNVQLQLENREAHESNCSFIKIRCAMLHCPWTGNLQNVTAHWSSKKIKSKAYNASNVCQTRIKSNCYYANIVEAYDQLFWFKCKLERGKIYWAVQFLGHSDKAAKYFYEIEVFKPDYAKKKVLFSDYCQSVDLHDWDLFKDSVCVTASIDCLNNFIDRDQLLIYYMRVHQTEECPDSHQCWDAEELASSTSNDSKQKDYSTNRGPNSRHKMEAYGSSNSQPSARYGGSDVKTFRKKHFSH